MKLEDFRKKNEMSYRALADFLGYNFSIVFKWCNGQRMPTVKAIFKIEQKTKGQVKLDDFKS